MGLTLHALLVLAPCVTSLAPLAPITISFLPRPRLVVLGQQGVGKSSISNALLGYDNTAEKRKNREQSPFKIGHGLKSKTQLTTYSVGRWLGGPVAGHSHGGDVNITVVDTPGFKDTKDAQFVEEITSVLGDEVPEVDAFLVVFKYKDRFTGPFKRTLTMISKMLGDIWDNVVVVVTFWDAGDEKRDRRLAEGVTKKKYTQQIQKIFKKQIGAVKTNVPVVFLDSHFTKDDPMEVAFFEKEADMLLKTVRKMKAFECLKRSDIQKKLKNNKNKLSKLKKKENKRRRKLEASVRMLNTSVTAGESLIQFYRENCPSVSPGCRWGEWSEWSKCEAGTRDRRRPGLVGQGGETCQGENSEVETGCTEGADLSDNWREHQDTVALLLGGVDAQDQLVGTEVLSSSPVCTAPELPVPLQSMAAAYSAKHGIMVCGGKDKTSVSGQCWGYSSSSHMWQSVTTLPTSVWGATASWFGGRFWVIGGSTSDGKGRFSTNKQAMVWDPVTGQWEETQVAGQRGVVGACLVTIEEELEVGEEALVFIGGSKKNIKMNKRNHGLKSASWRFDPGADIDDQEWSNLPQMKKGRTGHGCAVATIDGSTGIVVAGGSADGDSVEFMNLEDKKNPNLHWVKTSVLSRQRIFGTALAHIRGRLSMVGGFTWPSTVPEVERLGAAWEEEDEGEEGWTLDPVNLVDRVFHVAVTVPANIFPTCPLL